MESTGVVKVADLRTALQRLLDAIEEQIGSEIDLATDFYWNVPNQAAYQVDADPELDVGSVFDDVQSVSDYASGDANEPTIIWHECEHLAGVLRAIANLEMS
jgi:hypothetical protein